VFIYPILNMLITTLKDLRDTMDPTVTWIPTKLYLRNYEIAYQSSDTLQSNGKHYFWTVFMNSTLITARARWVTC